MAAPVLGSATAITITTNSLANNAARASTAVDSSGSPGFDYLIGGSIKTATGTISTTTPYVNIYVSAITDGTNYSGAASGTDGAYTRPTYWQPRLLTTVWINTANTVEYFSPVGIAQLFGGFPPDKFIIIIENVSGLALDASAGGSIYYRKVTTA